MGNCQVRFCRRGWRSDSSLDSNLTINSRSGKIKVSHTHSTAMEVLRFFRELQKLTLTR